MLSGGCDVNKSFVDVLLRVPSRFSYQLVFRQSRDESFLVAPVEGARFEVVGDWLSAVRCFRVLQGLYGGLGALKSLLKVCRGQVFYFVSDNGVVAHTGWMTTSRCNHYRVESGDVVIGPIWSAEACRGRGLAVFGTQSAINAMIRRGARVFFIDTSNTNVPCLKVIEKSGFGAPVAAYLRD